MKKFSAIVAALSVVFTGLTATAASATTYTPNESSNVVGAYWTDNIPSDGVIGVPAAPKRFSISKRWGWTGTKLADILSTEIDFTWSLTLPNGTVVNSSNSSQNNFYANTDANLQGNGAYRNFMGTGPTLAITPTPVVGENYTTAEVSFSLQASNAALLAAGNYTLAVQIFVDGNAYTDFTTQGSDTAHAISSSYYITGTKSLGTSIDVDFLTVGKTQIQNTTCVDTTQLQVGDELTIRRIVDGNVIPSVVAGVDRSIYASLATPGAGSSYVNTSMDQDDNITFTTTQDMIDRGVKIESYLEYLDAASANPEVTVDNSLSAGSHTVGVSIAKADGTEVTSGCFPPVPATPTVTISGQSVSAAATGSFLSSSEVNYVCQAYKASDNSPIGSEATGYTTGWSNGAATNVSCSNIIGITGGTTFYVKLIAKSAFYSGWASTSSQSANATLPASGVTITSTASNGTAFGNVKALPSIDLVTLAGSGMQSTAGIAEPTGGVFEFNKNSSNVAIRHITTAGLDATFGTKTFATPYQSANMTANYHGTLTAPKPFALFSSQVMSPEVTIKDYNFDGTTGSTRVVSNAQLVALCTSSSLGNTFNNAAAAYGVSSPTSEVYFQVACTTAPGASTQSGYVLAKVDITGSANPVVVTTLGTPTAENTSFQTQGSQMGMSGIPTSVNWTATGSTPMLTFIAMPYKPGTCNPSCAATYTGTAKIARISAAGAALPQATAGITNPVEAGASLSVSMSPTNFGEILATRRVTVNGPNGSTTSVTFVKVGASGNGTAFTPTWDASTNQLPESSNLGSILGKTSDGQYVMLRSASAAGVNTVKMVKVNFATGAVTSFGEAYSYSSSGAPAIFTVAAGVNGFLFLATSAVNAGKFDLLLGVGGGADVTPTPTAPVPNGDASTELGRSLNTGSKLTLTINGTGLNLVTGVKFGTVTAKFAKTATKLTITVPAGTTGTSAVTVLYAGGTIAVGDWEYLGATKRSQTLTPTGLGDPTHSGATEAERNFTVASSLDGYAVTVVSKSATVCTYVSGVIEFVGNGTCVLQATQAGDVVTNAASVTYEIYYESEINASALYSTDAGKPTITLTGVGLGAVDKVVFGTIEVVPSKKTDTSITVKVPTAPTSGANLDVKLRYDATTVVDTGLDFDFVGTAKLAQTVTLEAGFSLATYGDAARTLTASSVDGADNDLTGLPYVFSTTTSAVCAVSGDQLRFVGSGICTVKVSQAGNAGVNAAAAVTFNITVSKKDQEIQVDTTARDITDVDGVNLEAENSNSEVALEYVSSDESICTVDGEGYVTGLAEGACTITISAAGDARYNAAPEQRLTVNVTLDTTTVVPESEPEIVDATPVAVSPGGVNTFISLGDPSLQVSWDKATGKLTPRATGVYTGYISAEVKFTVGGVLKTCTTVFGSNAALKVPAKPVLAANPTAKQTAAYNKALAAYNKAYKAAWGSKTFKSAVFCADASKLTGSTFAALKKASKSSSEKKVEAANFKLLKNFTGSVTITVKRWRAWPTTGKNIKGTAGKRIPAVTNKYTLTLG